MLAKMPDFPKIAGIFIFGLEHVVKIDQTHFFLQNLFDIRMATFGTFISHFEKKVKKTGFLAHPSMQESI